MRSNSKSARYKAVWKQIDNIDQRHVLKKTADWTLKEVKAIVDALKFHGDKTRTDVNRMYHRRVTETLTKIVESDRKVDYFIMNVLKDNIHNMWIYGFRKVSLKWKEDKTGEHVQSWYNKERFYRLWAGNDKKGDDVTEHQRFYFFYNFLKATQNDLSDCFQSYVHDFYQRFWGVRNVAEMLEEITKNADRINEKQYRGFVKRASELLRYKAGTGEWTWKESKLYREVWSEYLYLKNYKAKRHEQDQVRCDDINCDELIKLHNKDVILALTGQGVKPKHCSKHSQRKKKDE